MEKLTITAPGEYLLNMKHSMSKSIVYINGTNGGATLNFNGVGGSTFTDGAAIGVDTQTEIRHGADAPIYLEVVGGTGINLMVSCTGIH